MPLAKFLEAGAHIGLGTDVAGGPDASQFSVMRVGAYAQMARRSLAGDEGAILDPLGWLRLATLDGARALGLEGTSDDDPNDLVSRLIFRAHPDMVRGAWVRGRRLAGPGRAVGEAAVAAS